MIIIETQYPQSNKKVKDNERWKVNKVEERLNFINNSDISQKHRDLNFGPLRRGVLVPHGKYTFLLGHPLNHVGSTTLTKRDLPKDM